SLAAFELRAARNRRSTSHASGGEGKAKSRRLEYCLYSAQRQKPPPFPQPHQACDLLRIGDVAPLRKREKEGAHRASTTMFYEEIAMCQFRKEKERSKISRHE